MITAITFLRAKGLLAADKTKFIICSKNGTAPVELTELLDEYHKIKMEEAGFKKDDKNREDTIKL